MIEVFVKQETGEVLVIDNREVYYCANEFVEMQSFETTPSEYKELVKHCNKQDLEINESGHLVIGRNKRIQYKEVIAVPEMILQHAQKEGKAVAIATTNGSYGTSEKYTMLEKREKDKIVYRLLDLRKLKKVRIKGVDNE